MEMSRMRYRSLCLVLCTVGALVVTGARAGALDPDCNAEKAAKSAAMKATVGVGGRCDAKEAAADTAREAAGVEKKGALEKKKDDEGALKKGAKKIVN